LTRDLHGFGKTEKENGKMIEKWFGIFGNGKYTIEKSANKKKRDINFCRSTHSVYKFAIDDDYGVLFDDSFFASQVFFFCIFFEKTYVVHIELP
jgi:hypothetical protein